MKWYAIAGITSTIAFFLPVITIIYYRMYRHRSLAALMMYYLITAVHNLMIQGILGVSPSFQETFGIINNFLDAPLMLVALLFFCPAKENQMAVNIIAGTFIVYEVTIIALLGFNLKSVIYVIGPGLLLIFTYSFYLFVRQIKFAIVHGKGVGRAIMLASILFAYGCYLLIYYFYYIQKTPYIGDTFLLYFICSFIASIFMTIGLSMTRKRLQELEDLKHTRRELSVFFKS
ncbi:MAG: hypothetical protein ICV66_08640 [Chitinophagaceae bacterium]|nr:hypothetical protein [Chitinophagaceae bacterium]